VAQRDGTLISTPLWLLRPPNPQPQPPQPLNLQTGKSPAPYDYLPFFYSRVFNLSWQFYGSAPPTAQIVTFGLPAALTAAAAAQPAKFGAYWVDQGRVVGVFIESGSADECAAAKAVAKAKPAAPGAPGELESAGAEFLTAAAAKL